MNGLTFASRDPTEMAVGWLGGEDTVPAGARRKSPYSTYNLLSSVEYILRSSVDLLYVGM